MQKIKVAIVEDNKKLLKLLSMLIQSMEEFELTGAFHNGNLFLNDFNLSISSSSCSSYNAA